MDETTMMTTTKTITVTMPRTSKTSKTLYIGLSNHLANNQLLIILRSVPLFYWPTTNKIPGRRNINYSRPSTSTGEH
ncbi:hypothetical protein PSHT_03783 [Puccinia striiformis]|uniref:Uncharacterized protein n=1 Tax=Puccinia striiformis TaxID=27350 RepID=A0A2S4WEJ8_9BASI|nr:hypothetical protein PSHT_03783 [Puccinia striiformis]